MFSHVLLNQQIIYYFKTYVDMASLNKVLFVKFYFTHYFIVINEYNIQSLKITKTAKEMLEIEVNKNARKGTKNQLFWYF